jgi:signal transduction histidine kinase
MFGLRSKLALGFAGLLALLVLLGLQSVALLSELGGSIDVILRENYRSVAACQEMKEAIERMDSGALFALDGDPGDIERGRALIERNRPRFERALGFELHNVTLPGEGERAKRLAALYQAYWSLLPQVLDAAVPLPARREAYFGRLLPVFQEIKATADQVQQLNQNNMLEANARARRLAAKANRRMVLLLLLGAAVAVGFVIFLSRAILVPLRRLTESAHEIEGGNLDLVVQVTSKDELGQLAAAFNAMAESLRELRRSDQARLLRTQQTSQLAIDNLPDVVAVFSPAGPAAQPAIVELVNQTAIATLGLKPGEPVPESHAVWLQPLLAQATREGTLPERGHEAAIQLFQEGKERFFLPRATAIRDSRDRLLSIILILADVTDLRRVDEMKSDLLSTVSHELRTPLTSLQMAVHILLGEGTGALNPQQTDLLLAARDDAERLREIISSLLEISRLESRQRLLRYEPVATRDFVDGAVQEFQAPYGDSGVALTVDVDPRAEKVRIDPARARLVLANLLSNALHHTPAGGAVRVSATPQNGFVRFAVTDTGRGIPAEHAGKVFERFFQVPGTEDFGGAGLGLSIAKEIVHTHGGEMHCQSREGEGTTFWFTLPLAEKPETTAP